MLADALVNDPNQGAIETSLKALLRKRRHGGTVTTQSSPIEDYFDELNLNQAFLLQVEEKLGEKKTNDSDELD